MNIEDSFDTTFTNDADAGICAADATALFHRLGAVTTTAIAAASEDSLDASSVANLALRRMGFQLASSMSKLVDDFSSLLDLLSGPDGTPCEVNRSTRVIQEEAEQLRQQLIFGGYRLANELQKVVRAQHSHASSSNNKSGVPISQKQSKKTSHSVVVIDIQDILQTIRGRLRAR